jgi:outer membrane lipoprotein-sorting protein
MHLRKTVVSLVLLPGALLAGRVARADDLSSVLQALNVAAKDFHSATANFEFDTIQTDPIPDTDVQKGVTYYNRKGNSLQWAAHVQQHNDRPNGKTYMYAGGVFRLSDTGKESDAKTYSQVTKYESYMALAFGASGTDLQAKWDIKYLGQEKIDGVTTDKLELVPKDPAARKIFSKVTTWEDPTRAISIKLIFDEGEGQSYVCHYTDIKLNQSLPGNAFSFSK